jgi:hypothetical protein
MKSTLHKDSTVTALQAKPKNGASVAPPASGLTFIDSSSVQRKENKTGMPDQLKSGVESLSGIDMSDVKVHYNSSQPAQLNAHAYAQGNQIHIAPGQEKHLPHEAWHVVQQKQGRVQPTKQLKGKVNVNDDAGLEKEADVMGNKTISKIHQGPTKMPLQGMFVHSSVAQLISDAQRLALVAPFMNNVNHLYIGRITAMSTLRDYRTNEIEKLAAGIVIVYQGNLRDNFSKGFTSVVKDHVYASVVSNPAGQFTVNPANWPSGWIVYENIETDSAGSTALHAAPAAANVPLHIQNYFQGVVNAAGVIPQRVLNRRDLAPKAIKAWAEKTHNPLTTAMPLNALGLANVDLNNTANNQYDTIDPNGDLGLDRLDHNSNFFVNAQQFLNLNAAAMPGTMAKNHELRDEGVGGPRAVLGRAWLASYAGKNLNDAEIVAITGATLTNIFINRNAPTWAAYEANVQHHLNNRNFAAANANWQASATIRGAGNDALIDQMTQARAGEYYLFHGTSRANVFNISKSGFDPEFVNYTRIKGYGKTGYGTAFTDQFAKALAYAPPEVIPAPPGGAVTYKHYVLVARVFAGRTHQVGDRARRTRGNLEMTQYNVNYEEAKGNKMKAQGQGMPFLGQSSSTVADSYAAGTPLHSTVQDRNFDLDLTAEAAQPAQHIQYRDTSLTVSDAIQMYPAYIIECTIPAANMRKGARN